MKKKANPATIGAFVVGAIALAVAGLIVFGGGGPFDDKNRYVIYFEGSVKGLSIGASVGCKGVRVGQVVDILMHLDAKDMTFRIPVIIEIRGGRVTAVNTDVVGIIPFEDQEEVVLDLINRGLRAKLDIQSFVTGQLYVSLDFYPDHPLNLVSTQTGATDIDYIEIPSIPSEREIFSRALANLPLEEILGDMRDSLTGITRIINGEEIDTVLETGAVTVTDIHRLVGKLDGNMKRLVDHFDLVLGDLRQVVGKIDRQVDPLAQSIVAGAKATGSAMDQARKTFALEEGKMARLLESLVDTSEAANQTFQEATEAMTLAQELLKEDSTLNYEVTSMLTELSAMARSVRGFAEYLQRHPEALVRGKGAP